MFIKKKKDTRGRGRSKWREATGEARGLFQETGSLAASGSRVYRDAGPRNWNNERDERARGRARNLTELEPESVSLFFSN